MLKKKKKITRRKMLAQDIIPLGKELGCPLEWASHSRAHISYNFPPALNRASTHAAKWRTGKRVEEARTGSEVTEAPGRTQAKSPGTLFVLDTEKLC